ncbi:MAG: hypothetical protein J5746_01830 [Victivallales bacterium]|nr:hypothetical protein [Victivallales bacterium]
MTSKQSDNKTVQASQQINAVRRSCTAFSWDVDGLCLGIRLECGAGDKLRIAAIWKAEDKSHGQEQKGAFAEMLSDGRRQLGVNEASYCLASPMAGAWGMADLEMPMLKEQELRAALAFELRKSTPLPAEQLEWGYRILETKQDGQAKRLKLRLFYVKKDVWRKWLAAATGLSKVDILAPAPVLLDPVFSDVAVTFPGKASFRYVQGTNGREAVPFELPANASVRELLPFEGLDLGELSSLPEQEQLAFLPAIVTAAYGLTRSVAQDARTLPELPSELRPKRYQACKIVATVLCAFIVICLCYGFMQGFQIRKTRLRLIQKDIKTVENEMKSLKAASGGKYAEAAKMLEEEMARYKIDAPLLSDVLIELTKQTKPPAWFAGPFTWTMDIGSSVVPVTFVLREPMGDTANMDISLRLNNSPILGDVVETKSANNRAGYSERRFVLKARYDTPEEKKALETYLKQQKQAQKQKANDAIDAVVEGGSGDALEIQVEEE